MSSDAGRPAETRGSSAPSAPGAPAPSRQPFFSGEPLVLAHRGASAYAPDHTLTAVRLALQQGADVIEADINMTRDGHPILHHSGELSENTEAHGPIRRRTLREVQALDAGYVWSSDGGRTHRYRGKGERIHTLDLMLETFPDTRFNLEIKDRPAAEATRRVVDRHAAHRRVLLAAWFSWRRARALRGYRGPCSVTQDQMLAYMLLYWTRTDRLWQPAVDVFQLPETYHGIRVVTPRLISRAHQHGIRIHVWTVDREDDMDRLLGWGVDGIVTKRPDVAVRARARYLGQRLET